MLDDLAGGVGHGEGELLARDVDGLHEADAIEAAAGARLEIAGEVDVGEGDGELLAGGELGGGVFLQVGAQRGDARNV